jgi:hypothetical protein
MATGEHNRCRWFVLVPRRGPESPAAATASHAESVKFTAAAQRAGYLGVVVGGCCFVGNGPSVRLLLPAGVVNVTDFGLLGSTAIKNLPDRGMLFPSALTAVVPWGA